MDYIINTKGLSYSYHNGQKALFNVDIGIKYGEKTAVIGSNGVGKSTLFLCLNGINKPQKGEVFFKDEKIDYSSKGLLNLRRSVGIVFQNPDDMIFSSSVRQDIAFGLLNMGLSNSQTEEKIKSISEFLNLESLLDKPVHALSGGEKKRVSLAGVMVMEPEVIILDEPGAYLDTENAKTVYKIIDSLSQKGKTVIISSHNMDFVLNWADSVIVLKEGKVVFDGRTESLFLNNEILNYAALDEPQIIKTYKMLVNKGVIKTGAPVPKNITELEMLIK